MSAVSRLKPRTGANMQTKLAPFCLETWKVANSTMQAASLQRCKNTGRCWYTSIPISEAVVPRDSFIHSSPCPFPPVLNYQAEMFLAFIVQMLEQEHDQADGQPAH